MKDKFKTPEEQVMYERELVNAMVARIAAKSNPTAVEITERIKRKYWI